MNGDGREKEGMRGVTARGGGNREDSRSLRELRNEQASYSLSTPLLSLGSQQVSREDSSLYASFRQFDFSCNGRPRVTGDKG